MALFVIIFAEIASVTVPYEATGPDQLSLQIGQLINVRQKSDTGWWEGEMPTRGEKSKLGWFPANYVKMLSSGAETEYRTPQAKSMVC